MTTTASDTRALWQHIFGEQRGYIRVFSGRRATPGADLTDVHKQFYSAQHAAANAEQWVIDEDAAGRDAYMAAHLFTSNVIPKGKRLKDIAADVLTLYADIDEGQIPTDLPPSALVQSSPGRLQGWWRLSRAVPPATAENLNRRIAQLCSGDPSGFDITQNLRPPDSHNHKYADAPRVRLLYIHDEIAYDPDELDRVLPAIEDQPAARHTPTPDDVDEPPIPGVDAALWQGKRPKYKRDGNIQRYTSLLKLGRGIYDAGGTRHWI